MKGRRTLHFLLLVGALFPVSEPADDGPFASALRCPASCRSHSLATAAPFQDPVGMRVDQRGIPSTALRGEARGGLLVLRLRGSGAPQPRRDSRPVERSAWGRMLNSALGVLRRTGLLRRTGRKPGRAETRPGVRQSPEKRPAGGKWDRREAGEQAKRAKQWEVSDKQATARDNAAARRESERHTYDTERRVAGLSIEDMVVTRTDTTRMAQAATENRWTEDAFFDIDHITDVTQVREDLPIIAAQVDNALLDQALKECRAVLFTPHAPMQSVVLADWDEMAEGHTILLLNQSVRATTPGELPEEAGPTLRSQEAPLLPLCIGSSWNFEDTWLRMAGRCMWLRPINTTRLFDVPLEALWKCGVPTSPDDFEPWAVAVAAAGYLDGTAEYEGGSLLAEQLAEEEARLAVEVEAELGGSLLAEKLAKEEEARVAVEVEAELVRGIGDEAGDILKAVVQSGFGALPQASELVTSPGTKRTQAGDLVAFRLTTPPDKEGAMHVVLGGMQPGEFARVMLMEGPDDEGLIEEPDGKGGLEELDVDSKMGRKKRKTTKKDSPDPTRNSASKQNSALGAESRVDDEEPMVEEDDDEEMKRGEARKGG
ncbi:hypothetical protein T484DRAFT_1884729, partial [Baffinella frigidus]